MIKAFSAIATAALVAAAVTLLPGMSPNVAAPPAAQSASSQALPQSEPCTGRGWPYPQCTSGDASHPVRNIRLITTDRL
jgi:hypothetical protein